MNPLDIAQQYFDAWNAHDPQAVTNLFKENGTYSDPGVRNLTGAAIGNYVEGLINMFPDMSYTIESKGLMGPDLVSAQWVMHGTHQELRSQVALPGADFIQVENGQIHSVQGYFDNQTMQKQLGLEVITYPAKSQGPISFGSVVRFQRRRKNRPGAISLTWLEGQTAADDQHVSTYTEKIVKESIRLPGFLSIMLPTIGQRGYTITAWENVDQPRQLLRGGQHKESMKWFFSPESQAIGMTSVWELHHMRMMLRCSGCNKVVDVDTTEQKCSCGETLPEPPVYW